LDRSGQNVSNFGASENAGAGWGMAVDLATDQAGRRKKRRFMRVQRYFHKTAPSRCGSGTIWLNAV
jgi:hypothetical protein